MAHYDVLGPYIIALFMSLAGVFVFIWGVLAGAFRGADEEALRFYRAEVESDANHKQTNQ